MSKKKDDKDNYTKVIVLITAIVQLITSIITLINR